MAERSLLDGKKVLIVDDEPDVLEILSEILSMCHISEANNYSEAKDLLDRYKFDLAILDIMGVKGYELLKLAKEKNVVAVMLTAHALSPENLQKAIDEGAASYIPKNEISNICTFLEDILEAQEKGKHLWWKWFDRFSGFFEKRFGEEWKNENEEYFKNLKYRI